MQGTTSLLGASDPVWVLGVCYEGCNAPQGDAPPALKQEVYYLRRIVTVCIPPRGCQSIQKLLKVKGKAAEDAQVLNAILSDLMSRIWMTYRRGFPAIGGC